MNIIHLLIVIISIAGIAAGRIPALRMNRATIAFSGAVLLVVSGACTFNESWEMIDGTTLILLFSMMIINASLRLSGFFEMINYRITAIVVHPLILLAVICFLSSVLSAFFVNDTVVLVLTPLIIEMVKGLKRNVIPYLMAAALSSNIGSAASITGNPQNMIIGNTSKIPFAEFMKILAPVSAAGTVIAFLVIAVLYRPEFKCRFDSVIEYPVRVYRPLLIKSSVAATLMIAGFFYGVPVALSAASGAAILLISRRLKPEKVIREVDFTLLVFFSGLFVITGIVEKHWGNYLCSEFLPLIKENVFRFSCFSAILSNIVSNVPAVMLLKNTISEMADPKKFWMILAMSSTFAGNLTLLGSVANLIVAENAYRKNVTLSFREYLRAGIPVTLLSIAAGILWFYY